MSRTVSLTLDDETADVVEAIAIVEQVGGRTRHATVCKEVLGTWARHQTKRDARVRSVVAHIRKLRRVQQPLPGIDDGD